MISKAAKNILVEVKKRNKRIIVASFIGNPILTILVHYSPVEGSDEAEEHYEQLALQKKKFLNKTNWW